MAAVIDLRPPGLATVSPSTQKLLGPPGKPFIKFTDAWQLGDVSDKLFNIKVSNQVTYVIHEIIPVNDEILIDLSNGTATSKNLYPTAVNWLYEINIGFRPGNYMVYVQVPVGTYMDRLHEASMRPNVGNVTMRYLGAFKPEDSPSGDKRLFIYAVRDLEPIILETYVDSGSDFEKVVMDIVVNKCELEEIVNPTQDQLRKALEISYYTEQRGSATT